MRYSTQQKQDALRQLAANEGSYQRTSAQTGIPAATLRRWAAEQSALKAEATLRTLEAQVATLREHQPGDTPDDDPLLRLRGQLMYSALALADSLQDVIAEAPLSHRANALNQLLDKIIRLADVLPESSEQVIRIEYEDPEDDPFYTPPPGTEADQDE